MWTHLCGLGDCLAEDLDLRMMWRRPLYDAGAVMHMV